MGSEMCIRDRRISECLAEQGGRIDDWKAVAEAQKLVLPPERRRCLLYTSDAADERSSVDLGGRRLIKKKIVKIIRHAGRRRGNTKI